MKVSFLGLGVMGFPMARHLHEAGHEVRVFNRTAAKAQAHPAIACSTIEAAAQDAHIVFACVGNDADIDAVATTAFTAMSPGALFVDHTTASAAMARSLAARAAQTGLRFMDAPVSGGQAGAENGQLTIMCGGAQADFEVAQPIMQAYAKYCGLIGDVGAGQLTKMVNQTAIAGLLQALSEALNFGMKAGLDMDQVLAAIQGGAAGSWQMTNRGQTMLKDAFDFGFAVDWMVKDLDMILEAGKSIGADLSVTKQIAEFYAEIQAMGGGRWDTSSLIRRLIH